MAGFFLAIGHSLSNAEAAHVLQPEYPEIHIYFSLLIMLCHTASIRLIRFILISIQKCSKGYVGDPPGI